MKMTHLASAAALALLATAGAQAEGHYVAGVEGLQGPSVPPPGVYYLGYLVHYDINSLSAPGSSDAVPGRNKGSVTAVANRLVNQLGDINRVMITLEDLSGESFELRKTFATREGLDRLREVDHRLHRRIAHLAEIWQAPVISLPLFDRAGNQAFVLRPVCSKDAMTADVYPIDFALLAE